jgi:MFS family permease
MNNTILLSNNSSINYSPNIQDGVMGKQQSESDIRDDDDDDEETATALAITARIHYSSTIAMCLCTFTHSWLLVSVFPYSGFMVIKLVNGTNEENAGSYAGLLAAAFMIGRALTSYSWGRIADIYGRKIVFYISLVLSAIFSVFFGLSSSFGVAFLWRFLLGASNGLVGISKAVVSETARGNVQLETRGMSMSMGMWAWGFLLSPAIAGFLSDPIKQFPNLNLWVSKDQTIYKVLESYPFLLPNLISVLLCLIDFIAVVLWVPETLPETDIRSANKIPIDFRYWLRNLFSSSSTEPTNTNLINNQQLIPNEPSMVEEEEDNVLIHDHMTHSESISLLSTSSIQLPFLNNETCNDDDDYDPNTTCQSPPRKATLAFLWSKIDTRNHLIVFWIFSFVAIAIDEAFPLYCISKGGGLGLSEGSIGKLLSATGIIFALTQYHVYTWIVDTYGLRRSIQLGALLSAPLVTFVPLSLLLNDEGEGGKPSTSNSLTWGSFIYLSLLLSFIRIFGLVFFSSITIATNRTVIPSHRGTMNGLSMLGGSIAKGLGPIFAGLLMSSGISSGLFPPKVGSALVFVIIGLCSAITAGVTFVLIGNKQDNGDAYGTDNTIDISSGNSSSSSSGTINELLVEGKEVDRSKTII